MKVGSVVPCRGQFGRGPLTSIGHHGPWHQERSKHGEKRET